MGCVGPGLYPRRQGQRQPDLWERTGWAVHSPARDLPTVRTPSRDSSCASGREKDREGEKGQSSVGGDPSQLWAKATWWEERSLLPEAPREAVVAPGWGKTPDWSGEGEDCSPPPPLSPVSSAVGSSHFPQQPTRLFPTHPQAGGREIQS